MTWSLDTIIDDGNEFYILAAQIDSAGLPHVLLYKELAADSTDSLVYAYRDSGGTWQLETIETFAGATRPAADMVLDSNDKAHIVVGSDVSYLTTYVHYITNASGSWATEAIESLSGVPRIAVDSSDVPHVAYFGWGNHCHYATRAAGSWAVTDLFDFTNGGAVLALGFDGTDKPCLVLSIASNPPAGMVYTYYDGADWQIESYEHGWTDSAGYDGGIIDSDGVPHYIWMHATSHELFYLTRTGVETWSSASIGTALEAVDEPSCARDSSNNPHILYTGYDDGDALARLYYITRVGGVWSYTKVSEAAQDDLIWAKFGMAVRGSVKAAAVAFTGASSDPAAFLLEPAALGHVYTYGVREV